LAHANLDASVGQAALGQGVRGPLRTPFLMALHIQSTLYKENA